MRNSHFPGWGRPYEFNIQLMTRVGRAEEARDVVSSGAGRALACAAHLFFRFPPVLCAHPF